MTIAVAVFGDLHSNSTVGLLAPGITDDEGQEISQAPHQVWLWDVWQHMWSDIESDIKNADLILVALGDLTENAGHHGSSQFHSANEATEQRIALANLKPPLSLGPAHIFMVRGTEAHVGSSGAKEEMIGELVESEPHPETGRRTAFHWPLELDGVRIDLAHHGRLGIRPWTAANQVQMQAAELTFNHFGNPQYPHLAIRGHRHRWGDSFDNFPIRTIQIPGWQFPTSYVYRSPTGLLTPFGGIVIFCDGGQYEVKKYRYQAERPKQWTMKSGQSRGLLKSLLSRA